MGGFANPLPGYPYPPWAIPYGVSVGIWYIINLSCVILSLHLFARALEQHVRVEAQSGVWQSWWLLRLGPLIALLPFVGSGLQRGQPTAILLVLMVAFFVLYLEKRLVTASLVLALAIAIKIFPIVLALFPFLRRDWRFICWMIGWCAVLLIGLPILCLGPIATFGLYHMLWTQHLAGIITGVMSTALASELSPGAYSSVSIGAVLARIAAGEGFYSAPLPGWAYTIQYIFDIGFVVAIAAVGHGRFWTLRGPQPSAGATLLIAGAVLIGAIPLMISVAKPHYITLALPLVAVIMIEAWRHTGQKALTNTMILWTVFAWISIMMLELPVWNWIKIVGPMTCALVLLLRPTISLLRAGSYDGTAPIALKETGQGGL
jgi:hypothetical protein